MKTKHCIASTLFTGILTSLPLHALEVHEWGTFTVLTSSQGQVTQWYQPYSDIAKLPPFTYNFGLAKAAIKGSVRMETPVIYFYPEKEMKVTAEVSFARGYITERFPASLPGFENITMGVNPPERSPTIPSPFPVFRIPTTWSGTLLPPDHADAKLIPAVAPQKSENYAAAREVPDAWIFRSDTPVIKTKDQPDIHPIEKFIFYRGVGEGYPMISASMPDNDTMRLSNSGNIASDFQVALRVRGNKASWVKLPSLPAHVYEQNVEPKLSQVDGTFPAEDKSIEQVDKELSALFLTELTARGLTDAEAKAMLATWNHTWFSEPGQRIFSILPSEWVDQVLPLTITPTPKTIKRVFVARLEVLSPETEDKLTELLQRKTITPADVKNFAALNLGRFSEGATTITTDKIKQAMFQQFYLLREASDEQQAEALEKGVSAR